MQKEYKRGTHDLACDMNKTGGWQWHKVIHRDNSRRAFSCLLGVDDNCLQALEGCNGNEASIRVELLLGILLVITLALKLDADPVRHSFHTLRPELLVELRVDANVLGAHLFLSESNDGLDSPRSALLEGSAMDIFVQMDSVFTGDDVLEGGAGLAAGLFVRRGHGDS